MAKKKITELQLITALGPDLNLPGDDGTQTFRVTTAQLKAFIIGTVEDRLDLIEADDWVTTPRLADGSVNFPAFAGLPTFQAKPPINTTLPANTLTYMNLNNIGLDTLGGTPAVNSYSIGVDGFYLVIASWNQSKTNTINASDAYLAKNGTTFASQYHSTGASGAGHCLAQVVPAVVGDTIGTHIRCIGYTGTTIESKTGLSIIRIA